MWVTIIFLNCIKYNFNSIISNFGKSLFSVEVMNVKKKHFLGFISSKKRELASSRSPPPSRFAIVADVVVGVLEISVRPIGLLLFWVQKKTRERAHVKLINIFGRSDRFQILNRSCRVKTKGSPMFCGSVMKVTKQSMSNFELSEIDKSSTNEIIFFLSFD